MSSVRLGVKHEKLVCNLVFALAFLAALSSASIISVAAYSPSTNRQDISPQNYPITLTSPNAQDDGFFGGSVAISGRLAIVGADAETADGYSGAGHAYIFNTTTGSLIANLTSPNAQAGGEFGYSVAINGKLAIVGASDETVNGYADAGRAYVFNADTGSLIANLTSPNAQTRGYFGVSVAINGKLAIVGAPDETVDGVSYVGRVYVFNPDTGSLITTLMSPNSQVGLFGHSVTINGNLVIVGAPYETVDGYTDAGQAYAFNANTGKLISTITSPNAQESGDFGWSVAIGGKLMTVGAWGETVDGHSDAGHAYIFNTNTGKLISTLTSPNEQKNGWFGFSVAINGKLVTVGAPVETADSYAGAGHAYIFDANTGKLITTLSSPNAQKGGEFGRSVTISGKLAIIGADSEIVDGYTDAGHAYIFN